MAEIEAQVLCGTYLVPCKLYSFVIDFLLFVTLKTSHLSGLNCMSQVNSHCCKASMSFCKILVSSELFIFRYSRQSSANNHAVAVTCSGGSLGREVDPRRLPVVRQMLWLKLLISLPSVGLAVFVQIGSWLSIVSSFLAFRISCIC